MPDRGLISFVIQSAFAITFIELLIMALGKERKVQRVTCGVLAGLVVGAWITVGMQIMPWGI